MPPTSEETHEPLVSELPDDDMVELVNMFVEELPEKNKAIIKAIEERNLAILETLAHQLKGAAGGYGFPSISAAAQSLEASARQREDSEALLKHTCTLDILCRRARVTASAS